jgi:hypothetical protein
MMYVNPKADPSLGLEEMSVAGFDKLISLSKFDAEEIGSIVFNTVNEGEYPRHFAANSHVHILDPNPTNPDILDVPVYFEVTVESVGKFVFVVS